MAGDWTTLPLEDCMAAIIDYRGKSPEKTTFGVPLVTAKIVKGGRIEKPEEFIAEADFDDWMRRGMPQPGDIVMTTEAPLGEVAQLDDRKVALAQRVITLRGKPDVLDNTFLKFLLQSNPVQEELRSRGTGTTVIGIRQSELRKISLTLPPLFEQRAIAAVLGALDDKIELNRRMNATLESMARELFQSWFVDFDPVRAKLDGRKPEGMDKATAALFPDAFEHTSDGEMVPKGWKMKCTADLFEVRDGTHDSPKRREHGFPLITSKHITNGGVDIENAYLISEEDFIQVNKRSKVDKFDTLMTMIGTVGVPLLVHEREPNFAIKNIGLFKTSKAREFSYYFYLYLISPEMQQFLKSRLAGTTQAFLSLGILRSLPILVPDSSLLLAFNKVCEQLFGIIATNRHQTDTLANLRDTLLPKLLSGELSVASIPKVKA